jgi:hypothetical protein
MDLSAFVSANDQGPGRLLEIEKVLGHGIDLVRSKFYDLHPIAFSPNLEKQGTGHVIAVTPTRHF